jgi:hypothetical protein
VRIAGQDFLLRHREVERAMRRVEPEPIVSHFVVIAHRRFPPKQVIGTVTGLDRADFTTHQARRTLMRLGFQAGRRTAGRTGGGPASSPGEFPLADRLVSLQGQWVAIKDDDILHAAASPQELVAWLAKHGRAADSMFRVPQDEAAATGLAPL